MGFCTTHRNIQSKPFFNNSGLPLSCKILKTHILEINNRFFSETKISLRQNEGIRFLVFVLTILYTNLYKSGLIGQFTIKLFGTHSRSKASSGKEMLVIQLYNLIVGCRDWTLPLTSNSSDNKTTYKQQQSIQNDNGIKLFTFRAWES